MSRERYIEANQLWNKAAYIGCLHSDANCSKTISHAHSIQKKRYLKSIAFNSDVTCIDYSQVSPDNPLGINRVGIKKASTFRGFCSEHDNRLFKPIEERRYSPNDSEQNFLFAYRAFAQGFCERYSRLQFMLNQSTYYQKQGLLDLNLQSRIDKYQKHIGSLDKLRMALNTDLNNKHFDSIASDIIVWPKEYKITATSMFYLERDAAGTVLNTPSQLHYPILFTVIPQDGHTYAILSYLSKEGRKYEFVKSQIMNKAQDKQEMLLSNIIAMYVGNFYVNPQQWEDANRTKVNRFCEVFSDTMGKSKPPIGQYTDLNVFEMLSPT